MEVGLWGKTWGRQESFSKKIANVDDWRRQVKNYKWRNGMRKTERQDGYDLWELIGHHG